MGIRVIKVDGRKMTTGGMFVRGLIGVLCGIIPFRLDDLWILWDRDAQTIHDKLAETVVVRAQGSQKVVEKGSLGPVPAGYERPLFGPPVTLPASTPPAPDSAEALQQLDDLRAKNLITDEEYQAKRKAILDRL